jgi:hypothetical protein
LEVGGWKRLAEQAGISQVSPTNTSRQGMSELRACTAGAVARRSDVADASRLCRQPPSVADASRLASRLASRHASS